MTKYYKTYKNGKGTAQEVPKEEAKKTLEGYWDKKELDRIFDNDIGFRLFTPYAIVWTKNEKGQVPMAGFYGVLE